MINLMEGIFSGCSDKRVPKGMCVMYAKGEIVYVGDIRNSPDPETGWMVVLNPKDFKSISDAMQKFKH